LINTLNRKLGSLAAWKLGNSNDFKEAWKFGGLATATTLMTKTKTKKPDNRKTTKIKKLETPAGKS